MFLSVVDLGPKFDGFAGPSLAFLVLAAALAILWVALFTWRWFRTFPYLPDAAAATNQLGEEPPAVVNMLVNRCKVTRGALLATFADLAARGYLEIQQLDREHFVVRLRPHRLEGAQLSRYERQMIDFVRGRATGGSAPFEALLFDDEGEGEGFWKRFREAVIADARSRRLVRRRWSAHDIGLLGGVLAAALGLAAFAFGLAHLAEGLGSGSDKFDRWDWFIAAAVTWVVVMGGVGAQRSLRFSAAGNRACSGWLGVQHYLRESKAVSNVPIAAVVLWERYLSQGIALGVAHEAARALPFESEDPESAWSRAGGDWHELRVEYPHRFGACQPPGKVLFEGIVRAVFWGVLAFIVLPVLLRVVWSTGTSILEDSGLDATDQERGIAALVGFFLLMFSIIGIYLTARFLGGVFRIVRAVGDLGKARQVEGEIVKMHDGRVAIDDGKQREVTAWMPPLGTTGLGRGAKIRVTITPHLHYVSKVELLSPSPVRPPVDATERSAAFPLSSAPPLAVDALQAATGLRLEAVSSRQAGTEGGFAREQLFADASGNRIAVRVIPVPPIAMRAMSMLSGRMGRRATPVPGLGREAWWAPEGGLGMVTPAGLALIHPELPGQTAETHLAVATRVAQVILSQSPEADPAGVNAPASYA